MPKRNTILDQIRNSTKNESKRIHTLFPNRRTVRGDALAAFIDNNMELMNLWGWSLQATSDTKMKAWLQGVKAVMLTLQFLLNSPLGNIILKQTHNLSKTSKSAKLHFCKYKRVSLCQCSEYFFLEI